MSRGDNFVRNRARVGNKPIGRLPTTEVQIIEGKFKITCPYCTCIRKVSKATLNGMSKDMELKKICDRCSRAYYYKI